MANNEEWSLELFIKKFTVITKMGWIKTHRAGPTGIGKTLEDLLGIKENNIQGPDFDTYELKSMRQNANSMLTLITKTPDTPKANTILRKTFGYSSGHYDNDEQVLHATLSTNHFSPIANTGNSLKIACDDDNINIISQDGKVEAQYKITSLISKLNSKYNNNHFVLARADSRGQGADEEFKFTEAYLLDGFDADGIINLIKNGKIFVDLRIGQYHHGNNKGKTHDHGTGFRIFERDYHLIFNKKRIV